MLDDCCQNAGDLFWSEPDEETCTCDCHVWDPVDLDDE